MITFIPVGGLANRMRSINSSISLSNDDDLIIYWFKDKGLNCCFSQLFKPIPLPNVTLIEANFWHKISVDRPRKKNLYIPRFYQKLRFDSCLYENETKEGHLNYLQWTKQHKSVYLASYNQFYTPSNKLKNLFIPTDYIQERINETCSHHTQHTIGVHIRRGDLEIAYKKSPIKLFVDAMEQAIQKNPDCNFYLATDSETDKYFLNKRFGNRIICLQQAADRNSILGMENAVIDLYALARTQTIFGSFYSSYSEIAAQLGQGNLHILTI